MRLVFVNRVFYPNHSATSQILTDLCFALAARGHEVHVVTSQMLYDDSVDRLAAEEIICPVVPIADHPVAFGDTPPTLRAEGELDHLGAARHSPLAGGELDHLGAARHSPLAGGELDHLGAARHSPLAGGELDHLGAARHPSLAGGERDRREVVVRVHRVWTSRFGRGTLLRRAMDYVTFYASALWRLGRRADHDTILVAKTDPPMISAVVALAARATGARLVNWTQDLFPEVAVAVGIRVMRPALARWLAAVRDWSLRCAVRNVVIGEHMRARLLARGLPDSKIAVIHNWADGEAIVPEAPVGVRGGAGIPPYGAEGGDRGVPGEVFRTNSLRREWGLEGKFVVGYSGNLGRVHEFVTVLDAAAQLANRDDIVFLFIGGGYQLGALKAEAARRGLANVQFRPYQPRARLAQSLGACDAHLVTLLPGLDGLVLPSKFYGIVAAGRPVLFVGAGEGEVPDLVREADCGAVFGVGEAAALADCIRRMAADRSVAKRWGENGRRLFDARFAMPIAIGRWERLLAEVARE